jgi:tetratricopeptide (TPR) repeat protein
MILPSLAAVLAMSAGARAPAPDAESDAFAAAFTLKKVGKSAEAAAAFEAIVKTYPASARIGEALVEAGVGWFGVGRDKQVFHRSTPDSDKAFDSALKLFARVATDRPDDPSAGRAQYMRGSTHLFQGDLAGAEADYGGVLDKFSNDTKYVAKSLERRAAVRRHLLQSDLALADLQRYQKDFPKGEESKAVAQYIQFVSMFEKPAPPLEAEAWIQGGPLSLESLRGKVVGVYFFATWCENCAKEQSFVLDIEQRYAPAGLALVGVLDHSRGQTADSVRAYLASNKIGFAAMMDRGRTTPAYHGSTIPDLVLIDKTGKTRWHDNPANLADYTIETLLGEDATPLSPSKPK